MNTTINCKQPIYPSVNRHGTPSADVSIKKKISNQANEVTKQDQKCTYL